MVQGFFWLMQVNRAILRRRIPLWQLQLYLSVLCLVICSTLVTYLLSICWLSFQFCFSDLVCFSTLLKNTTLLHWKQVITKMHQVPSTCLFSMFYFSESCILELLFDEYYYQAPWLGQPTPCISTLYIFTESPIFKKGIPFNSVVNLSLREKIRAGKQPKAVYLFCYSNLLFDLFISSLTFACDLVCFTPLLLSVRMYYR